MLLTVSKRLEFSASRRLFVPDWSEAENLAAFGPETSARYGTGRNYIAYFILSGDPNPANGMLVNISEIKKRASQRRSLTDFDHKFLNEDHPPSQNSRRQRKTSRVELFAETLAALRRFEREPGGGSSCRNIRSQCHILFRCGRGSELLVRVFGRAPDDVAASQRGGERKAFRHLYFPPRPQLSCASDISRRTLLRR